MAAVINFGKSLKKTGLRKILIKKGNLVDKIFLSILSDRGVICFSL